MFAGMLLMPETSFRFMYNKFKEETEGNEKDTVILLMNYYQAPYMAVLIRCYELGLPDSNWPHLQQILNPDCRNICKIRSVSVPKWHKHYFVS